MGDKNDCTVVCNGCGFAGKPSEFKGAGLSVYHDMRCPKCKTTDLDTSDILRVWPDYGYGNDNTLLTKKVERSNG